MSVNIACSALGCTNPVIGQCTGYKKACGKYYCHTHSMDTLCAECTSRKLADDHAQAIYQDYINTAQQLESESSSTSISWDSIKGWGILMGISILIIVISSAVTRNQNNTLACVGALIFFVSLLGIVATRTGHIRKQGEIKATEIEKSKPGFLEFYSTWKKEKSKEQLMTALTVVGVITAVGLAATSESDYDRTRRAIRDENK